MSFKKAIPRRTNNTPSHSWPEQSLGGMNDSKTEFINPPRNYQKGDSDHFNQSKRLETHLAEMLNTLVQQRTLAQKERALPAQSNSEVLNLDGAKSVHQPTTISNATNEHQLPSLSSINRDNLIAESLEKLRRINDSMQTSTYDAPQQSEIECQNSHPAANNCQNNSHSADSKIIAGRDDVVLSETSQREKKRPKFELPPKGSDGEALNADDEVGDYSHNLLSKESKPPELKTQTTNQGLEERKNQPSARTESSKLNEQNKELSTESIFPNRFLGPTYANNPMALLQNLQIAAQLRSGFPHLLANNPAYSLLNPLMYSALLQGGQYSPGLPLFMNPELLLLQRQLEFQRLLVSQALSEQRINGLGATTQPEASINVQKSPITESSANQSTVITEVTNKESISQEKPKPEVTPDTALRKAKRGGISETKAKEATTTKQQVVEVAQTRRTRNLSKQPPKTITNEEVQDTLNPPQQISAQEPSQLEENLPLQAKRVTRNSRKTPERPPNQVLTSHFTEKLFKPRKRNRLQILHEEREKTSQQKKSFNKQSDQAQDKDNISVLTTESFGKETLLSSQEPRKDTRIGESFQARIPQLQLKKPEPIRKFKSVWSPNEIEEAVMEELIALAMTVIKSNFCRQDFLVRLLRHNNMDAQLTLDLLQSNVDYFSNLMKSKRSYNSFKKIAIPDIENPLTWSDGED